MGQMVLERKQEKKSGTVAKKFYLAAWRWHFYAGLFVVPFMIMLSITGIIMVVHRPLENWQYGDRLYVSAAQNALPLAAEAQVAAVAQSYPDAQITKYIPPTASNRSAQVVISPATADPSLPPWKRPSETVFVDPYNGQILGTLDPSTTWYAWANDVHGSFFMGQTGDYLIELASSLSILLVFTGIFMWWPRKDKTWRDMLVPSFKRLRKAGRRGWWKELHAMLGFWLSLVFIFFLISGLAWTSIWGREFVQPWSSFPAERSKAPPSDLTHADLNRGTLEEMPWGLELTPLPASGSLAGAAGIPAEFPVSLDTVIAFARDNGFVNFRVDLPTRDDGVWTISANTSRGDVVDPRQERTIHIDRYTGNKLVDIKFKDYSLMAKSMSAGIALHLGEVGMLNMVFNLLFCVAIIFISVSGVVMWWLRRPQAGIYKLVAPPLPKEINVWRGTVVLMLILSLAFPLAAAVLLTLIVLDMLVFSRIPALKTFFA